MAFAGLANAKDRGDIIAYLKSQSWEVQNWKYFLELFEIPLIKLSTGRILYSHIYDDNKKCADSA